MGVPERLTYLFYRYYENTCTPSEKEELFQLLLHPGHDALLRDLIDKTWAKDIPSHLQDPATADRILQYIIQQQPAVHLPPRRKPIFFRYAAAILILLSVTGLTYYFYTSHTPAPVSALTDITRPVIDQCLTLSDGSKVLLHKNAHIDFDPAFSGKTREVTLVGEAYFDIRHDTRPFIVHTGRITTTVLGTAFNINAHEKGFTVTVLKGKVKVDNGSGDFSILKRNEQLMVDPVNHKLKKIQVNAKEEIAWKKPYLLFNDVSMKEAVEELQQQFHTSITLANPAAESCHVTASFTQGESLEQIIRVLSKINNMEYRLIPGGGFELNGEGCK
ncbi:FecR domain-containing protein [Flavitalea sp. BT771]|uniref:FecR family protein n=1 Tax=Flavitalea sp. BT771 TaxID=3063329 RepID=UPI0026E26FCC|nr:FecR domain-containing protein [Flavitalea sp. BT771]MDO6434724.1 FecR domain-containing protein [Flavitalea sp. BT771]MDV6223624.1 FecR domain-containing protein [Flavitalea sp. BT771]